MRRRRLAALVAGCVLAAACGGPAGPVAFDDDPGRIDVALVSALPEGVASDAVPLLQRNFLEGCVRGGADALPDIDPLRQEGLLAVCGCAYTSLVTKFRTEAQDASGPGADPDAVERDAVQRFVALEREIREGARYPPDAASLVAACIRRAAF